MASNLHENHSTSTGRTGSRARSYKHLNWYWNRSPPNPRETRTERDGCREGTGWLTSADAGLELPTVEHLLAVVRHGGAAASGGSVFPIGHLRCLGSWALAQFCFRPKKNRARALRPLQLRKIQDCAYPVGLSVLPFFSWQCIAFYQPIYYKYINKASRPLFSA
jgi:hypothetical protein